MSLTQKNKSVRDNQPTMASPSVRYQHHHQVKAAAQNHDSSPSKPQQKRSKKRRRAKNNTLKWWLIGFGALSVGLLMAVVALGAWVGFLYTSDDVLPNVESLGIDLGGKSEGEAAAALNAQWQNGLTVSDGEREWVVDYFDLGIWLDSEATAKAAVQEGRQSGSLLKAVFSSATVSPVFDIELGITQSALTDLAPQFETPATNAGVRFVNGKVEPTSARNGKFVDVHATIAALQHDASGILADGVLELVTIPIPAEITDSSAMVAQVSQLVNNWLYIQAYDPVTNDKFDWTLPPETWSTWLVASQDSGSSNGLAFSIDSNQASDYLTAQEQTLNSSSYLDIDEGIEAIQAAIKNYQTEATIRVYHHDIQHTVQNGETFSSIAYDYGIPYPWIQAANPNVSDALSAGQVITVPSPDALLPLPLVPDKRVIVSISQQKLWAYENDQLVWEWVISHRYFIESNFTRYFPDSIA